MMPIAAQIKNTHTTFLQTDAENQKKNYANHFIKSPRFQTECPNFRLGELSKVPRMLKGLNRIQLTYQDMEGKMHF